MLSRYSFWLVALISLMLPNMVLGQPPGRVTNDLVALYDFSEGSGSTVNDISGVGSPMNLTIASSSAVSWMSGGNGLAVNSETRIHSAGAATKLYNALTGSDEFTLEVWTRPHNTNPSGNLPRRIMTISDDANDRNLTMGLTSNGRYALRLRTDDDGDNNGMPDRNSSNNAASSAAVQHVVITRNGSETERIYVDGVQVASGTRNGDFSNWNSSYRFLLANEDNGTSRPYYGDYYLVAVYDDALSTSEIQQNYAAGYSVSGGGAGGGTCSLPWTEDFSLANHTTSDNGSTAWSTSYAGSNDFEVTNNQFEANNLDHVGIWTSELIDISGASAVNISLDARSQGSMESNTDYLRIYYKLDGGSEVLIAEREGNFNSDNTETITETGLSGNTVQIIIRAYNTASDEYYYLDNISVTGNCGGGGSTPNVEETCTLIEYTSGDHLFWLPGTPQGSDFIPDGTVTLTRFDDGTATVTGRIMAINDNSYKWDVTLNLANKRNWSQWSALGRGAKGSGLGDETTWDYYELLSSSRLDGLGPLSGQTLHLTHNPSNYHYGFQIGNGANDKDGDFGISGWFSFSGSYTGNGDLNSDANCGSTPPPHPSGLTPPSTPNCAAGNLLWQNNIDLNNLSGSYGIPAADVRLKSNGSTSYTLPISLPAEFNSAIDVTIEEAVSWDGYQARSGVGAQTAEQWKVAFFLSGVLQGETVYTEDIADGVASAEWVGSLGTVSLPNGADEIRIIHYEDPTYGTGSVSTANSVAPSSICISYVPGTPPPPPPTVPSNWSYTCDDEVSVEIVGLGIDGQSSASLNINDPGTVDSLVLIAVWKGGSNNPSTVTFSNGTQSFVASAATVSNPSNGNSCSSCRIYKGVLPGGAPQVSISNAGSDMQSFVAYVFRSGGSANAHVGVPIERYFYQGSETFNIAIPTGDAPRDITLTIPVSEMTSDSRTANFTASAGGVTQSGTINTFDVSLGQSLALVELTLTNVPVSATSLSLFIESPNSGGDSYVIGGFADVSIECSECEVSVTATSDPVNAEIPCAQDSIMLMADAGTIPPMSGLNYQYFEESNLSHLPDFSTLTAVASGKAANFDISLRQQDNDFAFRFTGFIDITTAGSYTFYTTSDDGSKLFIDGLEVVDNDGLHAPNEERGTVSLTVGLHSIEVTFFERSGGQVLDVSYAGPGISKMHIPASVLFCDQGSSYLYSWTGPNGFSSAMQNPKVAEPGLYIVTATDPTTSCSASDSITVTEEVCSPPVTNLQLTSLCSDDPDVFRRWRVRNSNSFPVTYWYQVVGTPQTDTLIAPPGDSFFNTNTVGGPNTTKISWLDENSIVRETVKASGGALCSTGEAALGDFVFIDNDGDGEQDPAEPGVPGVSVSVFRCGQSSPIATLTTDSMGRYLFTGLFPSRDYYVVFDSTTYPSGFTATTQNAVADDALDSDGDPATGATDCVTLAPGDTNLTLDQGLLPGCTLTDGGEIGDDQTFCVLRGLKVQPDTIRSISEPSGTVEYEWFYSFDETLPFEQWVLKKFENGPEYAPNKAKKTYYIVRRARRCPTEPWVYSNIVTITINYTPPVLFTFENDTCLNGERKVIFTAEKVPGTTYTWSFPGATDTDGEPVDPSVGNFEVYTTYPGVGGTFQASLMISTDDCDSTLTLDVMVDPCSNCDNILDAGLLSGSQASCELPFDPDAIAGTVATGGTGNLTYTWYYTETPSLPVQMWTEVAGYSGKNYNPGPLDTTTYFIRTAMRDGCLNGVQSNIVSVEVATSVQTLCKAWELYSQPHGFDLTGVTAPGYEDRYRWNAIREGGSLTSYDTDRSRLQGTIVSLDHANQQWFVDLNTMPRMDWLEWQSSGHPLAGTYEPSGLGGDMDHYSWDFYTIDGSNSYLFGLDIFQDDTLIVTGGYVQRGVGANGINEVNGIYAEFTFTSTSGQYSGTAIFRNKFTQCTDVCPATPQVAARVVMEGPYQASTQTMRTTLAENDLIPTSQPFNTAPWNYAGTESVPVLPSDSIVDWILIQFRETADSSVVAHEMVAFLKYNGDIIDLDGNSLAEAYLPLLDQPYYVVLSTRNHLSIMASYEVNKMGRVYLYNFTVSNSIFTKSNIPNTPAEEIAPNVFAMTQGDAANNKAVNSVDLQLMVQQYFQAGYLDADLDMNGVVNSVDIQRAVLRYFRISHVPNKSN